MYLSLYRTNMLQNPWFLACLQHTVGIGVNVRLHLCPLNSNRLYHVVTAVCAALHCIKRVMTRLPH